MSNFSTKATHMYGKKLEKESCRIACDIMQITIGMSFTLPLWMMENGKLKT